MSEQTDEIKAESAEQEIPGTLPVLPLRDTVVYPDTMIPLTIGQERSIKLIDDVLASNRLLVLVTSKDAEIETPGPDAAATTSAPSAWRTRWSSCPTTRCASSCRACAACASIASRKKSPTWSPTSRRSRRRRPEGREIDALRASLLGVFSKIVALVPYLPEELEMAAANVEEPGALAWLIASTMRIKTEEKQALLEESDVEKRLRKLISSSPASSRCSSWAPRSRATCAPRSTRSQREYFLRQQLKAIQAELGETDEQQAEANELRSRIDELKLPEEVDKAARRELDRLASISPQSAEYPVIRTYLDWIITLPWNVTSDDNLDIAHAREILDRDHYDLEKVKDRILEYLAVRKLKSDLHGPILCFVGPPGVGKTSLGRSIAEAHGAQVRAHQRRRRARRGRDPRPSAHVRGRDARHHHPRHARRRHQQPAVHDRRDRQDRRRLARRPVERAARGARPGAELHLPRPLHGPALRPLQGHVHHHGQPARADPAAAARPHGDHQAGRLHDRGEAAHRAASTSCPSRSRPTASSRRRSSSPTRRCARSSASYTREAGVRNLEREIGTVCRKLAREVAEKGKRQLQGERRPRARAARAAAHVQRGQAAHLGRRRRHRPRLDAGRRRHPLHRGDHHARHRPPHRHRPARRRDEGVGAGGHELRARPLAAARRARRLLPDARHPHPRARRRDPQGRAVAPA